MPPAVKKALEHVRSQHPSVTMVVFYPNQTWAYADDTGRGPLFGREIDVGLLEDAMDAVEALPAAYRLDLQ